MHTVSIAIPTPHAPTVHDWQASISAAITQAHTHGDLIGVAKLAGLLAMLHAPAVPAWLVANSGGIAQAETCDHKFHNGALHPDGGIQATCKKCGLVAVSQ